MKDRFIFPSTSVPSDSNCKHSERSYLGTEKPREIQKHQLSSDKVKVCHVVHANAVVRPYYFNSETGRGDGYY